MVRHHGTEDNTLGQTIVKPTALGPVANTDTKLLIYGLFQKGRVLAQDGIASCSSGSSVSSGRRQHLLGSAQQCVETYRQHRCGQRARENESAVHHRHASENEIAQAAGPNRRSNPGQTDGEHGGDANAGQNREVVPAALRSDEAFGARSYPSPCPPRPPRHRRTEF